jgi:hypothetical protein
MAKEQINYLNFVLVCFMSFDLYKYRDCLRMFHD